MHLGEGTSLLTFPQGRQRLLKALKDKFGGQKIEELILVGDAADTALASISQVITHTSVFINTLLSSLDIDKVVYIPGNHDHSVWTDYINTRYGENGDHHSNSPSGDLIYENGTIIYPPGDNNCKKACEDLLTIFFEYDFGPAWELIKSNNKYKFVIANPIYAVEQSGRTYVFTHGTHFKSVLTDYKYLIWFIDHTGLDERIAKIEFELYPNLSRASDLNDLEKRVAPFVDSLYISSKTHPTKRSDQLWYLYTVVTSHFDAHRIIPDDADNDYPTFEPPNFNNLVRDTKSIDLMFEYFFDHLKNYLGSDGINMGTQNITLVYGDTHDGGFVELNESGSNIRIYNLGSWVARHKSSHPPCHVFAVDHTGKESMLDISFNEVSILGKPIMKLAAADFENRYRPIGWFARWLLERFA
jgi:hypothetical protein